MNTNVRLLSYLAQFFVEWKMFQTCRENQFKYLIFSKFSPENRAFYEVMWKDIVLPDVCRTIKATHTHTQNM